MTYNLVVDWDQSQDRWFTEESAPLIQRLRKVVLMGHSAQHRVTHFEASGGSVISVVPAEQSKSL